MYKIKPGKYYLGDPCYAKLKNHTWMDVLNNSDFLESACIFDDGTIVAFRTMYGDGTYFGTTGFGYSVDAGLIGLVPYDMVSDEGHEKIRRYDLMKIFDIQTEKTFYEDNGMIALSGLEYIDTISDPDRDDYNQDDEEDE